MENRLQQPPSRKTNLEPQGTPPARSEQPPVPSLGSHRAQAPPGRPAAGRTGAEAALPLLELRAGPAALRQSRSAAEAEAAPPPPAPAPPVKGPSSPRPPPPALPNGSQRKRAGSVTQGLRQPRTAPGLTVTATQAPFTPLPALYSYGSDFGHSLRLARNYRRGRAGDTTGRSRREGRRGRPAPRPPYRPSRPPYPRGAGRRARGPRTRADTAPARTAPTPPTPHSPANHPPGEPRGAGPGNEVSHWLNRTSLTACPTPPLTSAAGRGSASFLPLPRGPGRQQRRGWPGAPPGLGPLSSPRAPSASRAERPPRSWAAPGGCGRVGGGRRGRCACARRSEARRGVVRMRGEGGAGASVRRRGEGRAPAHCHQLLRAGAEVPGGGRGSGAPCRHCQARRQSRPRLPRCPGLRRWVWRQSACA